MSPPHPGSVWTCRGHSGKGPQGRPDSTAGAPRYLRPSGPARPRAPCTWPFIFALAFPPWSGSPEGKGRQVGGERELGHAGSTPPHLVRAPARGGGCAPRPRERRRPRPARRAPAAHLSAGARGRTGPGTRGPAQLCRGFHAAVTQRSAAPTAPPAHPAEPWCPSPYVERGERARGCYSRARALALTLALPLGRRLRRALRLRLREEQQVPTATRRQRARPPGSPASDTASGIGVGHVTPPRPPRAAAPPTPPPRAPSPRPSRDNTPPSRGPTPSQALPRPARPRTRGVTAEFASLDPAESGRWELVGWPEAPSELREPHPCSPVQGQQNASVLLQVS